MATVGVRNEVVNCVATDIHHQEGFTIEEVALHNRAEDAWVIIDSRVYDITKFIDAHPGGAEIVLDYLGKDVADVLSSIDTHRHTRAAYELLHDFYVGVIKGAKIDIHADIAAKHEFDLKGYEENMIDWDKPVLSQVGKLGEKYEEWVHCPVDKKLRLFSNEFCELCSYCPWYAVPLVWVPFASYIAHTVYADVYKDLTYTQLTFILALFFCGIINWTLLEYLLHRFVFHAVPPAHSPTLITLHFLIHGQHHKVPFDNGRLVFPPVPASFLVIPLYLIFCIFGIVGKVLFTGTLIGYVLYDCLHYYLHHGSPAQGSYLKGLKNYHVIHHFVRNDKGFGISSKFWDIPFNTLPPRA